jgi:hypothetical protein
MGWIGNYPPSIWTISHPTHFLSFADYLKNP